MQLGPTKLVIWEEGECEVPQLCPWQPWVQWARCLSWRFITGAGRRRTESVNGATAMSLVSWIRRGACRSGHQLARSSNSLVIRVSGICLATPVLFRSLSLLFYWPLGCFTWKDFFPCRCPAQSLRPAQASTFCMDRSPFYSPGNSMRSSLVLSPQAQPVDVGTPVAR
jgi:hypothetical protein